MSASVIVLGSPVVPYGPRNFPEGGIHIKLGFICGIFIYLVSNQPLSAFLLLTLCRGSAYVFFYGYDPSNPSLDLIVV